jgi:N-acetylneuraminate epimerase
MPPPMPMKRAVLISLLAVAFHPQVISMHAQTKTMLEWERLPDLPDREGFATPFAGVSGGALIVGGGANFPDLRPWEGGRKIWYDSVFILEDPRGPWRTGFKLPRPAAYGVSLNTDSGMVCIGGGDATNHFRDVFELQWRDGRLEQKHFPPLPAPCAFFCGARLGDTLYVAGGIEAPTATKAMKTFWALDLKDTKAGWKVLEAWPGPERMLAVAAAQDGSFFLLSGTSLAAGSDGAPVRTYLKDAYRYTPGKGWKRIADLPCSVVAAPTPAITVGKKHVLVVSGDDGSKTGFKPQAEHPGFSRDVLDYDTGTDQWTNAGETPAPHVTLLVTPWRGGYVMPSGEKKPGFRTPAVWLATPK